MLWYVHESGGVESVGGIMLIEVWTLKKTLTLTLMSDVLCLMLRELGALLMMQVWSIGLGQKGKSRLKTFRRQQ